MPPSSEVVVLKAKVFTQPGMSWNGIPSLLQVRNIDALLQMCMFLYRLGLPEFLTNEWGSTFTKKMAQANDI